MSRGASAERMALIHPLGREARSKRRLEGLAYARNWRIANKPYFDAIYGEAK